MNWSAYIAGLIASAQGTLSITVLNSGVGWHIAEPYYIPVMLSIVMFSLGVVVSSCHMNVRFASRADIEKEAE